MRPGRRRAGWAIRLGLGLGLTSAAWAAAPAADAVAEATQGTATEPGEFKLTLGRYRMSSDSAGFVGTDLNLRWRREGRNLWLGAYQDREFGRQFRAGYDDQ